jgi:GT2 family glycosyltransferase
MEFNEKNTEILTVNYNTPDYIIDQYKSIRKFLGNEFIINVVDNSDGKIKKRGKKIIDLNKDLYDISIEDNNFKIFKIGKNLHHGPGMDYGINNIKSDYILILDSDISLKKNIIDVFNIYNEKEFSCMGLSIRVNKEGINIKNKNGIKYIHPSIILLNRLEYKNNSEKFIKHGAPCIKFMKNSDEEKLIDISNIRDNVFYSGQGTIKFYGLNM